ncbi:hypothetical protein Hanom_Chr09g00789141 [Helianthus anomalus]
MCSCKIIFKSPTHSRMNSIPPPNPQNKYYLKENLHRESKALHSQSTLHTQHSHAFHSHYKIPQITLNRSRVRHLQNAIHFLNNTRLQINLAVFSTISCSNCCDSIDLKSAS